MTYALLYGVEHPEGADLFGEDGDEGLIGKWEDACADRIDRFETKHPQGSWRDPDGRDVYVPDSPYESTIPLIGFYVAVGASGKAGVPGLEGFALTGAKAKYADAYKAARRRWRRFTKWCATQGIIMPKARLYLTETEVA
jgi:hypothetical protein